MTAEKTIAFGIAVFVIAFLWGEACGRLDERRRRRDRRHQQRRASAR